MTYTPCEIDDVDAVDLTALLKASLAERGIETETDLCAVCDADIDETVNDDTTAHWSATQVAVIEAWTCSTPCAAVYEAKRARS